MKKLIITTIIACTGFIAQAQPAIQAGLGISSDGFATAQLGFHYQFKVNKRAFFGQAGYIMELSQAEQSGAVGYVRIGAPLIIDRYLSVEPSIGYSYTLRSMDLPDLNRSGIIGSAYLVDKNRESDFLVGVNYASGTVYTCLGLRFKFD